jgi:hypothetical protein
VPFPHTPGIEPAGALAMTAWTISSTSKHPDEAFTLLKFLCGPEGQVLTARSGLAVPCTKSVAESDDFLQPGQRPANARLFVDLIESGRLGQMPPQSEFTRIMQEEVEKSIRLNLQTPEEAGKLIEERWLAEIQSPLRNKTYPKMPWKAVVGSAAGALFVLVVGLFFWLRREKLGAIDRSQERAGPRSHRLRLRRTHRGTPGTARLRTPSIPPLIDRRARRKCGTSDNRQPPAGVEPAPQAPRRGR